MMRKGFTLIELLVVVLITGILAAIALPKYQLAVEKSRATDRLLLATTIAKAQDLFYLSQGGYSDNFNDLILTWPVNGPNDSFKNLVTIFNKHGEVEVRHSVTSGDRTAYAIFVGLTEPKYKDHPEGVITCEPYGTSDMSRKVCESLCNGSPFDLGKRCVIGLYRGKKRSMSAPANGRNSPTLPI